MVEGEMDHAVRLRDAALQTLQVLDRAAMNRRAGGSEGRRFVVRAAKADHLMARRDQVRDDG